MPTNAHAGDAGYDLCSVSDEHITPGEYKTVGTGLRIAIPDGWAALLLPRSGLARDHGLGMLNSPGLVDSGYRGELKVLLINHDPDTAIDIKAGERIAQLMLVPFGQCDFLAVSELPNSSSTRGKRGFGSSGRT